MTDDTAGELARTRAELTKLRLELTEAYDLIAGLEDEKEHMRAGFQDTMDDIIKMCNDILGNLKS